LVLYIVVFDQYLVQSLLTGFDSISTLHVTVVKHSFIWNQSTKQHGQRLADLIFGGGETRSEKRTTCFDVHFWRLNGYFYENLSQKTNNVYNFLV
jgi:hypothetical protein